MRIPFAKAGAKASPASAVSTAGATTDPAKPDGKAETGRYVARSPLSLGGRRKVGISEIVALDDETARGLLACGAIAPAAVETAAATNDPAAEEKPPTKPETE